MTYLIGYHKQATIRVILHARRRLQHLVAKEEVEIEKSVSVVVRLDAEETDTPVAGVSDDQGGVRLTGGRQPAGKLELISARTTGTEPSWNKQLNCCASCSLIRRCRSDKLSRWF